MYSKYKMYVQYRYYTNNVFYGTTRLVNYYCAASAFYGTHNIVLIIYKVLRVQYE